MPWRRANAGKALWVMDAVYFMPRTHDYRYTKCETNIFDWSHLWIIIGSGSRLEVTCYEHDKA